jgi:hypothetical protein
VLDERGVPEIPRNPSGFALGPVGGISQPNLITNHGMNRIAQLNAFELSPTSGNAWRRWLAVGTGSAEPSVTNMTLANEVERAATSGTHPNGSNQYTLDTQNNVWRAESLVTRLVTMDENRNLTEFGFAQDITNDIVIRELLRDSQGNPITVSLLEGKTLRVDHTLIVELPAPAAGIPATININEYDAANNLVSSTPYDIVHGGHTRDSSPDGFFNPLTVWNPSTVGLAALRRITTALSYGRTGRITTNTQMDPAGNDSSSFSLALQSYTLGSYQRIKRVTIPTGSLNAPWYGYIISASSTFSGYNRAGWLVLFANPATYTKNDTDTLRVGIISSWARA